MTKSEVEAALNEAIKSYNEELNGYLIHCDEPERLDLLKIAATTMDCFADFKKVIVELAD